MNVIALNILCLFSVEPYKILTLSYLFSHTVTTIFININEYSFVELLINNSIVLQTDQYVFHT